MNIAYYILMEIVLILVLCLTHISIYVSTLKFVLSVMIIQVLDNQRVSLMTLKQYRMLKLFISL